MRKAGEAVRTDSLKWAEARNNFRKRPSAAYVSDDRMSPCSAQGYNRLRLVRVNPGWLLHQKAEAILSA